MTLQFSTLSFLNTLAILFIAAALLLPRFIEPPDDQQSPRELRTSSVGKPQMLIESPMPVASSARAGKPGGK
jgi:hypothetical protein